MRSIEAIDTDNLSITVQAGCILQDIQEAANHAGLLFPLSLGSEGSCTIGGNLSTNAGGTQVLRYGNTRDLCLGLEVVNASGEIYSGLSGLRKDNTGYDLKNLFIGAEGTLGIITRATLKLYPKPKATLTAFVAVNDLESCVNLLARAHQALSAQLTGFEVMNQFSMSLVSKHIPQLACPFPDAAWCVLLELSDSESEHHASAQLEDLLSIAMEQEVANNAIIADSLQKAKHLWHIRESITMAQAMEGLNIKNDISLPVSSITEFVRATDQALKDMLSGIQLVNFGHLGDGNLHYNVQAPAGMPASEFLHQFEERVNTLVYQKVKAFKGSISAEHGIGSLKVHTLPHYKDPVALKLMRQIKTSLDPLNTMNPNRVVMLT
jgi:FAD/FMN-containing dehydrogenase